MSVSMQHPDRAEQAMMARLFYIGTVFAIALASVRLVGASFASTGVYGGVGNDDIMRLMSVRDWLAGQSWYDMTQYRILAPEGLSLHWSRYVDLGIGAFVWLAALVLPMPMAETVAGIVWPLLLLVALTCLVAFGTRRLLGPGAGAIAALTVVLLPSVSSSYFGPGRLDHHNLQILLITAALYASLLPGRAVVMGGAAGIASAFSLTIGLEALFFVAAIGLLLVLQAAFALPGARWRLRGFALAVFLASVVLFAGQTPMAQWSMSQCDKLSPPYLAIAAIGTTASFAALALPWGRRGVAPFLLVVAGSVGAGLALSWPLISPCLSSPYAHLPQAAQAMISERISEAQPLIAHAQEFPLTFLAHFGGPLTVLAAASVLAFARRASQPVVLMVVFGWIAFAACLMQTRQIVLLIAVTPFLTGYALQPLLRARLAAPSLRNQSLLYLAVALTVFQPLVVTGVYSVLPTASASTDLAAGDPRGRPGVVSVKDAACRDFTTLELLNNLPPARILTGLNLGPRLIMATHHTGLSAPYHRSGAALLNGVEPFQGNAEGLIETMRQHQADYVVICRDSRFGQPDQIATKLASGTGVPGFMPVPVGHDDLLVFSYAGPL